MNKITFHTICKLACIAIVSSMLSSCEDAIRVNIDVFRDCTGTYLRENEIDYKVCNPEIVADFSSGQRIEATFYTIDVCDNPSVDNYKCNLAHPYESLIKVTDISN